MFTTLPEIQGTERKWETFLIHPIRSHDNKKKLLIAGSDTRGAAYGILELSRSMGISPWIWGADVIPEKKTLFCGIAPLNTCKAHLSHTAAYS